MTLILVRHGQSEWNLKNLFTGWRDPSLSDVGIYEARTTGEGLYLSGHKPDIAFTSGLQRAHQTLDIILEETLRTKPHPIEIIKNTALNERDYGDLSGLNKDDARIKWGEEQVQIWRRSYDISPPNGESLKDTAERVIPYYKETILPHIREGKTVLVVAHGNSLRALVMLLEHLSPSEIVQREIATGEPLIYSYINNKN